MYFGSECNWEALQGVDCNNDFLHPVGGGGGAVRIGGVDVAAKVSGVQGDFDSFANGSPDVLAQPGACVRVGGKGVTLVWCWFGSKVYEVLVSKVVSLLEVEHAICSFGEYEFFFVGHLNGTW